MCLSIINSICGCGSGESGCSVCGCCKACARELDGQEARQRGIFDAVKEMIPLDLLLGILSLMVLFLHLLHNNYTSPNIIHSLVLLNEMSYSKCYFYIRISVCLMK